MVPGLLPGWAPQWTPHPWPAPLVTPQIFWLPDPFSVPRVWRPPQVDPMVITGGNPLPAQAHAGWAPAWPPRENLRIPVHLHPHLAPNPYDIIPQLEWDMSLHPNTSRRLTGRNCIMPASPSFKEHATWPPTTRMVITCDSVMMRMWGAVLAENSRGVTMGDVLWAIYRYWRTPLTNHEFNELLRYNPLFYSKITDAFAKRCRRASGLAAVERSRGLRRIDLLGDRKMWWGAKALFSWRFVY